MLLLIDNYDSFTYNLVHYLAELGAPTHVVRNDDLTVDEAWALNPAAVLLSLAALGGVLALLAVTVASASLR